MSYHRQFCFPEAAVWRLQPRAAGPLLRSLVLTADPYFEVPYDYDRGLLVIDPRYDTLPVVGPGWESKVL